TCRAGARTGLNLGGWAGGVGQGALTRLAALPPGTTMVALVNDGGEKYLDTVFNDDWMQARELLAPATEREIDELLTKLRRNR
ncbi:cysteine synthase family protein, partial [Streptomyces sp. NPDC127044]